MCVVGIGFARGRILGHLHEGLGDHNVQHRHQDLLGFVIQYPSGCVQVILTELEGIALDDTGAYVIG
ncbi:hypothetical protein D3C87_2197780 [compost metagenome]